MSFHKNFSMRIDDEHLKMLDEITNLKEYDNYAQTIRFLIKRYYKKKFGTQGAKEENGTEENGKTKINKDAKETMYG